MVIKMKMPIRMMAYIISKLIKDKKEFTITSSAMDLRFKFSPVSGGMWLLEISLGAVDYVGRLSFSYFDRLDADVYKAHDFEGDTDGYDAIGLSMDCSDRLDCSQNILIRDKDPELFFKA